MKKTFSWLLVVGCWLIFSAASAADSAKGYQYCVKFADNSEQCHPLDSQEYDLGSYDDPLPCNVSTDYCPITVTVPVGEKFCIDVRMYSQRNTPTKAMCAISSYGTLSYVGEIGAEGIMINNTVMSGRGNVCYSYLKVKAWEATCK